MKKRFSITVLIAAMLISALIAVLITFGATYNFVRGQLDSRTGIDDMEMLKAVDSAYRNYYYGELDEAALERAAIQGYIYGTGDNYGEYMDAERVEEFTTDNNGENVGIGVSVVFNDDVGLLEIVNVIPDSPAEEAGLMVGDLISVIGGVDAAGMTYTEALSAMAGKENTEAVFSVTRGEEKIDFTIVRRKVTQQNAVGHMNVDGITAVIRLEEFDANTPSQFKSEISRLIDEGAQRFVFDVRNNPGGDLESVVEILDFLLPEGPIIRIFASDGEEVDRRTSDAECFEYPMAVLINENSASAAELFASALKDYELATLVGKTSYGKGSMQTILPLIDGSALRITYRMYSPPFSDNYDGVGVEPHIDVDMADDVKSISIYKLTDENDTQLKAAVDSFENDN
ncbi:MAG: PDZ domain-containing protein [Clostridia bacterium]|nr:PDZ domain-containing protein [Clostridia bacterium]